MSCLVFMAGEVEGDNDPESAVEKSGALPVALAVARARLKPPGACDPFPANISTASALLSTR